MSSTRAREMTDRRHAQMLADVRDGLRRRQRELPPKYFYDERGSQLFEDITRLPEYYLTRAETEILDANARAIVEITNARSLIELGAGSATKTRILLRAMSARAGRTTYMPVDVSEEFLRQTSVAIERDFPSLIVEPIVSDIGESLDVPASLDHPAMFAFLGSTIGNFDDASAVALLRRVRERMEPSDWLLLGTDLRKDVRTIELAYNDCAGVTAEFNRNMLCVVNAELGADFDPDRFAHHAFYDEELHRIEMHLVSVGDQRVRIPEIGELEFQHGESIRTELSYKYDRDAVNGLAAEAQLSVRYWFTDAESRFALSLVGPVP
jgi:L-histidine N-alpha-methyltransferase